ncbi:hypothetical protein J1P26_17240 [Neobacillus sp. MM2021_6]|uniref:hypothetical protein n=1 Tax=Bacillaceae TaxID=186817 RepID=UPI00140919A7|nr:MULTISPECIES: hypothetical protein [Bacillaceae]MBO0961453.1 hypothetical protein [Neobacillus sp. MM2021_6]NHC19558.1 hypothetical protein [Bacillus sp. MM2020_4]
MNALDRLIKAERKRRYKRLKKIRKARDMASKYTKRNITISKLDKFFNSDHVDCQFTGCLAKDIVDYENRILGLRLRPPMPKSKN